MEEGVGLQCQRAEVQCSMSKKGPSKKVNKHALGFKERSKQKGDEQTLARVQRKEQGSIKVNKRGARLKASSARFCFSYFDNYDGFLLKTGINFIKHNILRRFSITALECAS